MEKKIITKKNILIFILLVCVLAGAYGFWILIPDYSAQKALPDFSENVRSICRVNQSGASRLYKTYISEPDSLDDVERKKVAAIVKLLNSYQLTKKDEKEYILAIAAASGCGYSILAEIIVDRYQDKPDIFEAEYGYPLYYEQNGEIDFNSEALFTDIFLRMNKSEVKKISYEPDNAKFILTKFGMSLYGTDIRFDEMPRYLTAVIGEESKTAAAKRDVSYNTYAKYMIRNDYDYACIGVQKFTLKPYGSNPSEDDFNSDGGHWMRITGVTKDNHFIVSSWGDEWEIIESNPYFKEKTGLFQPKHDNDGGLVFLKIIE